MDSVVASFYLRLPRSQDALGNALAREAALLLKLLLPGQRSPVEVQLRRHECSQVQLGNKGKNDVPGNERGILGGFLRSTTPTSSDGETI